MLTLALLYAGTASGYLLGKFCPNDGVHCGEADPGSQTLGYRCQGHMLWLIITLLTCMSPFGILVFQVGFGVLGDLVPILTMQLDASQPSLPGF